MNLLRTTIEISNKILGRLKAGRKIDISQKLDRVCLNLGSGLAVAKGWINIDGSPNALVAVMPVMFHSLMYRFTGANRYYSKEVYCRLLRDHKFIHYDLSYGIPLAENVADYIYSSHFIEHLYRKDADHLLNECYRVLKKNGVLRISIPDLEYALALYGSGKKEEMLQQYFFVEDHGSDYSRHKYMYDFEMLSKLLKEIGFSDIRRCQFQCGDVPDVKSLDNRPEDSLILEAKR